MKLEKGKKVHIAHNTGSSWEQRGPFTIVAVKEQPARAKLTVSTSCWYRARDLFHRKDQARKECIKRNSTEATG